MIPERDRQRGSGRWLAVAAVLAAAVGLAAGWQVAQPPRNLDQYARLGGEIGCTCGTCPLRPIATCGCPYADGMLDVLQTLVDEGNADETIMVAFVDQYGDSIRIAPHSSGFDLAVWVAPMMFLTLGAVGIGAIILRWTRRPAATDPEPATAPSTNAGDGVDADLRARVDAELAALDG